MRALARVDLAAIERNCARLARVAAPARLCAVVKADGYGHGAEQAARAAQAGGATWLAVATAEEAAGLRAAGIDGPLLVMGALTRGRADDRAAARARTSSRGARASSPRSPPIRTATGPACTSSSTPAWAGSARATPARRRARPPRSPPRRGLRLAGAMTHFATSDSDPAFAREQLARFLPWAEALRDGARRAAAARGELRRDARDRRVAARPRALRDRRLRDGPVRGGPRAARARRRRWSCAPTSPRSSRSRRARASATAAASSRRRRPGSARCRSATATACAAR